ncbi:MAG TPA: cytochrome c [Candidatus Eisenbacteria bacterium]|jgi:mono/diheme cytochrome c family protein
MHARRVAALLVLAAVVWGAVLAAAETPVPKPDPAAAAKRAQGRYLVQIMGCGDCHTPGSFYGAPDPERALSGSEMGWRGPWGVRYAANITPDLDTGIGYWTAAELAKTLRTGVRPDGTQIGAPMPIQNIMQMTQADAEAVAAYLMSLKPIRHQVPAALPPGVAPTGPVLDFPPPSAWDAPKPPPAAPGGEKR